MLSRMEQIKYEEFIELHEFFFFMPYYSRPERNEWRNAGRLFFFFLVCVELFLRISR